MGFDPALNLANQIGRGLKPKLVQRVAASDLPDLAALLLANNVAPEIEIDVGLGITGGAFSQVASYLAGTLGAHASQTVYVTDAPWLVRPDGVSDASPGINAALAFVALRGGGVVLLPIGLYNCLSQIVVPKSVTLAGVAIGPFDNTASPLTDVRAPTLLIRQSVNEGVNLSAPGAKLRDVLIYYPDQVPVSAAVPIPYPYAVIMAQGCGSQSVERCTIVNAYQGIDAASGRTSILNCLIGAYSNDIRADRAYDWVEIHNVKCQLMWNAYAGALPLGQPIDTWVMNNSVALRTGRVDSLQCTNFGVFGRFTGHEAVQSALTDIPQRGGYGRLTNVDFDYVAYGVSANASNVSAQGYSYTNMSVGPNASGVGTAGQAAVITTVGAPAGSEPIVSWGGGHQRGTWAAGSLPIIRNAGRVYLDNVRGVNPFGVITSPPVPISGTVGITNPYPFAVRIGMVFGGGAATSVRINGSGTGLSGTSVPITLGVGEAISADYPGTLTWAWFGL